MEILLLFYLLSTVLEPVISAATKQFQDELKAKFSFFESDQYQSQILELNKLILQRFPEMMKAKTLRDNMENVMADTDELSELSQTSATDFLKYQGDIILSPNQFDMLLSSLNGGRGRHKRKVISDTTLRWRSTRIPYTMEPDLDPSSRKSIRDATKHWEKNTCIRFTRSNGKIAGDHLNFFSGHGCYSTVGRTGGQQGVSIGYGCGTMGIVAHEIGHSLGFWHEQSRPDRSKYVEINYDNVLLGSAGNFQINTLSETEFLGQPYDLGSIMHYGGKAFSANGADTIVTRDPSFQSTIGQRKQLSFIDIKQANKMYCSDVCRDSSLICKNGGYLDPNNCARCKCPSGFGGIRCNIAQASQSCVGGILKGSTARNTLKSPKPRPYMNCNWLVQCPVGQTVGAELRKVSFYCRSTCYDFVEIKASEFELTGARYCCDISSSQLFDAKGDTMAVMMQTTKHVSSYIEGFELDYWCKTVPLPLPGPLVPRASKTFAEWSEWSPWEPCNAKCTMCGLKKRRRVCSASGSATQCEGMDQQISRCVSETCTPGKIPPKITGQVGVKTCEKNFTLNCGYLPILRKAFPDLKLVERMKAPVKSTRSTCYDVSTNCKGLRARCKIDDNFSPRFCPKYCGFCMALKKPEERAIKIIKPPTGEGKAPCLDKETSCPEWAGIGECTANPRYMQVYCAASCNICSTRMGRKTTTVTTTTTTTTTTITTTTIRTTTPRRVVGTTPKPSGTCRDRNAKCPQWEREGECIFNKNWMAQNCAVSCVNCPGITPPTAAPVVSKKSLDCIDSDRNCQSWARSGECKANAAWMAEHCARSCKACKKDELTKCADTNTQCHQWATTGECTRNLSWMLQFCAKSCDSCPDSFSTQFDIPFISDFDNDAMPPGFDRPKRETLAAPTLSDLTDNVCTIQVSGPCEGQLKDIKTNADLVQISNAVKRASQPSIIFSTDDLEGRQFGPIVPEMIPEKTRPVRAPDPPRRKVPPLLKRRESRGKREATNHADPFQIVASNVDGNVGRDVGSFARDVENHVASETTPYCCYVPQSFEKICGN